MIVIFKSIVDRQINTKHGKLELNETRIIMQFSKTKSTIPFSLKFTVPNASLAEQRMSTILAHPISTPSGGEGVSDKSAE
jgi:hypothetical protein